MTDKIYTVPIEKISYGMVYSPQPVGYWKLGEGNGMMVKFPMYKKPTDEQIKNHTEMLGWIWEDA
jgi:hypothetical protein